MARAACDRARRMPAVGEPRISLPMTLRELLARRRDRSAAGRSGRDDVPIAGLAYRSEGVTPGTLFFCVPGFVVDGHEFAADAVRRGAAALVCERPLGIGRAGGGGAERARGDGAAGGRLPRPAHGAAAGGRRDRHERQDHDRLPGAARARGGRHPDRAAGDGALGRRRPGRGGRADHSGGGRPAGDVRAHARRRATGRA